MASSYRKFVSKWEAWLLYGPAKEIENGFRVEDFVKPGYLVMIEGHWQRVRHVIESRNIGKSVLITEYGARMSLDAPPPPSFRYREPSPLPVAGLTLAGVIIAVLGLIAAAIAAFASVYPLLHQPPIAGTVAAPLSMPEPSVAPPPGSHQSGALQNHPGQ